MPTTSFFTAESRIPIAQKKISVAAENGLSYKLGQRINFVVPSSTGYFMPSETYLRMDVKVQMPVDVAGSMTKLSLDGQLGANVLIRDITIRSGGAQNVLLEEIQNVNVLTALRYDYETNDNIKAKRALTEGSQFKSVENRGTLGAEESLMNNHRSNSFYDHSSATFGNDSYKTCKALIRLPAGIFQNDRVFPLGLTDGLRIEILLEEAPKVFRQLDNVIKDRAITSNCRFHSINGSDTVGAANHWQSGSGTTTIFFERDNDLLSANSLPFAVGETISWYDPTNDVDAAATADVVITAISFEAGAGSVSRVKITFTSVTQTSGATIGPGYFAYSRSVTTWTTPPTASIDDVELLIQQVTMPDGYTATMNEMLKAGGSLNYDFLSYTNYKTSIQSTDRVANIRLPIQNSRCKSILCIPTDASVYSAMDSMSGTGTYKVNDVTHDCGTSGVNNSTRSGLVGIADHLTNYQFLYDGKLNPSRKVPCGRTSINSSKRQGINQQVLIECEKALHMANIDPLSFRSFQENFFIARALSLSDGVYDGRGKDFSLQLEYQETTAPTKNKLVHCFVAHLRRIIVSGDNISIQV
tara:strand:+ start:828 stop:2579 length:1752 start_codon:yes stop_codon:yes gene_type:complete